MNYLRKMIENARNARKEVLEAKTPTSYAAASKRLDAWINRVSIVARKGKLEAARLIKEAA